LKKIANVISFVKDLNAARNNKFYIMLMKSYGINAKVDIIKDWLHSMRKKILLPGENIRGIIN
jgi:hypothetical protein